MNKMNNRSTMEMALQELGRLDLVGYVKRNQRVIKFLDSLTDADINDHLRNVNHENLQRWNLQNDRETANAEKRKKEQMHRQEIKCNGENCTGIVNAQKAVSAEQGKSNSKIIRKEASSDSNVAHSRSSDSKIIVAVTLCLSTVLVCLLALLFVHKYRKQKCWVQFSSDKWSNEKENSDDCCRCCRCKEQLNEKFHTCPYNIDNESEWKWSKCTSGYCDCRRNLYCQTSKQISDVDCKEQLSMTGLPAYKDIKLRNGNRRRVSKRKKRRLAESDIKKKSRSSKRHKDQINYKRKSFKKERFERGRHDNIRENTMSDVSDVSILAQSAKMYDRQEPKDINQGMINIFETGHSQCGCCRCAFTSEETLWKNVQLSEHN